MWKDNLRQSICVHCTYHQQHTLIYCTFPEYILQDHIESYLMRFKQPHGKFQTNDDNDDQ